MLVIGLMTGTSMDGIDAALLDTDGMFDIKTICHMQLAYDSKFQIILKSAEYAIKKRGNIEFAEKYFELDQLEFFKKIHYSAENKNTYQYNTIKKINIYLAELHIKIIKKILIKADISISKIKAIGYHGQTVLHSPLQKKSITLSMPELLYKKFAVDIVHNFRLNDIKNGGQGAPLAPIYHYALAVRDNLVPVAVVNCGGVANISIIHSNKTNSIIGFDTGPGNNLIDKFVRMKTNGEFNMDMDGKFASQGQIIPEMIDILYNQSTDNYYKKPYPKSLDANDLILPSELLSLSLFDGCKNLAYFTVKTITAALNKFPLNKVILAGGGWYNKELLRMLSKEIKTSIVLADDINWSNDFLEAEIFAYLAIRRLLQLPATYPNITGCEADTVAGDIFNQV